MQHDVRGYLILLHPVERIAAVEIDSDGAVRAIADIYDQTDDGETSWDWDRARPVTLTALVDELLAQPGARQRG
jgi:hypothetical protein